MSTPENIFLIGPMGVGKTTIGRHLASLTDKKFVDVDQELERRTGASISLIFDIEGEAGFRKRETAMLDELTQGSNIVLASGGGAVLREENRKFLRSRGFVVYLHADIGTLVERTSRDKGRPLLKNVDRQEKLAELMAEREPIYRSEADLVVETDQRPAMSVARTVLKKIKDAVNDADSAA